MFDHQHEVEGDPVDEAERLDRALVDIDWTVPARGAVASTFEAPSGGLAVTSLGDPRHPRVLLVPGVTGSKEDFVLMLPLFAEAGFFVQAIDMAGQYQSGAAGPEAGERYDYDLFTRDLLALLEDGEPAHLLGYSFAGTIAMLALLERPDLVRSLTLLAAPPLAGDAFRGVRGLGPFAPFAPASLIARLMIWGIRTNKNHVPPKRLEFVRHRFAFTSRRSVADVIRLMQRTPDLAPAVNATPVPKLVAVGSHDLWPLELHARLAERIGARLAVYPTGHSPCETAPHQLTRDMLALFAEADQVKAPRSSAP